MDTLDKDAEYEVARQEKKTKTSREVHRCSERRRAVCWCDGEGC